MKASEHFDLPLCVGDHPSVSERVYESSEQEHCAEFNTPEQAAIAAKCINHADKLAEALELLIENERSMARDAWSSNGCKIHNFLLSDEFADFKQSLSKEIATLAAYRSEK